MDLAYDVIKAGLGDATIPLDVNLIFRVYVVSGRILYLGVSEHVL